MAIDKPLNGLLSQDDFDMGLEGLTVVEEEDVFPDSLTTELDDGGVLIDFDPMSNEMEMEDEFDSNLAEFIDDDELTTLANDCISKFNSDRTSRSDWEQTYKQGLDTMSLG